jgi:hypothetical protein
LVFNAPIDAVVSSFPDFASRQTVNGYLRQLSRLSDETGDEKDVRKTLLMCKAAQHFDDGQDPAAGVSVWPLRDSDDRERSTDCNVVGPGCTASHRPPACFFSAFQRPSWVDRALWAQAPRFSLAVARVLQKSNRKWN